ncbi:MAG: hypothetical protein K0U36_04890 [Alphaproteobacteria bacterium]|nr:hypothetical protein [Alphaproteobacteria bacterium]
MVQATANRFSPTAAESEYRWLPIGTSTDITNPTQHLPIGSWVAWAGDVNSLTDAHSHEVVPLSLTVDSPSWVAAAGIVAEDWWRPRIGLPPLIKVQVEGIVEMPYGSNINRTHIGRILFIDGTGTAVRVTSLNADKRRLLGELVEIEGAVARVHIVPYGGTYINA